MRRVRFEGPRRDAARAHWLRAVALYDEAMTLVARLNALDLATNDNIRRHRELERALRSHAQLKRHPTRAAAAQARVERAHQLVVQARGLSFRLDARLS